MGLTVFINLSINTASTEKKNFSDEKNQYQYYNSEPITTRSKQHLLTHYAEPPVLRGHSMMTQTMSVQYISKTTSLLKATMK